MSGGPSSPSQAHGDQLRPGIPCSTSKNCTSTVEGHEILRGIDLVRAARRAARDDGAERVGKIDPRQHPRRQPRLPGHQRPDPVFEVRTSRLGGRRAGARRACFSPSSTPRRSPASRCRQFLRQAVSARVASRCRCSRVRVAIMEWMKRLGMDPAIRRAATSTRASPEARRSATRSCRWPCSSPSVAILDETDSGLDIDALRIVARGIEEVRRLRPALGIAARHALPADPRASCGPTACTCSRRAHRRERRPRARRAPGPRGLRGAGALMSSTVDSARSRSPPQSARSSRYFSRSRTASALVYLDSASSAQRPRAVLDAMDQLLRDDACQRAPGRLRDRRGGDAPVRGSPRRRGRFIGAPRPGDGDRLHEERHRGASTSSPTPTAGTCLAGRQGDRAHRARAPRQHRAVADAG